MAVARWFRGRTVSVSVDEVRPLLIDGTEPKEIGMSPYRLARILVGPLGR